MKKMLTLTATLCLTSLFMENASAFQVIFTNESGIKGTFTTTIGANCPSSSSGDKNTWQSPTMYNGTAIGSLPCNVTSSSWNDGVYNFSWNNGHVSGSHTVTSPNDVDTVLKNGYTQVYVTVTEDHVIKKEFK
jgi:hypothetical protein